MAACLHDPRGPGRHCPAPPPAGLGPLAGPEPAGQAPAWGPLAGSGPAAVYGPLPPRTRPEGAERGFFLDRYVY